jgi:hypothetical protein
VPDKEAYKEANRYLHMITHAVIKAPMMRQAEAALKENDAKIMQLNQQG